MNQQKIDCKPCFDVSILKFAFIYIGTIVIVRNKDCTPIKNILLLCLTMTCSMSSSAIYQDFSSSFAIAILLVNLMVS
jgi:hypothetical protein